MDFTEKDLLSAQKEGIITAEIFEKLVIFLSKDKKTNTPIGSKKKKFTLENFLYYFGALIIIFTMGWYAGNIWDKFGDWALFGISLFYFVIFIITGHFLWRKNKITPGGLLYTCAVSVVPLGMWAFENAIGIFSGKFHLFNLFSGAKWIMSDIVTITIGCLILKYRKFPFITLPICIALWGLFMDFIPVFLANSGEPTWGMRNFATFLFAFIILGLALKFDNKTEEDFSGWFYIIGALILNGVVLSSMWQLKWESDFCYFIYCLFAVAYMVISIILQRKIFMVLGGLSVFGYLTYVSFKVFSNTPIFPLILLIIGMLTIFSGVYYSKNCEKIETKLRSIILGK